MTVTVQAVMAGVMIVRQAVVVAQQANPPMEIIVKRGQPVVAVLKAAAARTVMPVQTVMIAQAAMIVQIVIVLQNMIIAQTAIPAQTVKVALKAVMIKLAQPGAANQHLVTSQPGAANQHLVTSQPAVANQHLVTSQPVAANHLAANPPSINVQILVISQRRQSRHPIAAMMAQNAHHLPQKSASAQHGQGVMPHRRAVKAH
jgi:hypothetical protein